MATIEDFINKRNFMKDPFNFNPTEKIEQANEIVKKIANNSNWIIENNKRLNEKIDQIQSFSLDTYQKNILETIDNLNNVINLPNNDFSIEDPIKKFYDSFQIFQEIFTPGDIKRQIYEILTNKGWPVPSFISFNISTLNDLNEMSDDQIDNYMTLLMTADSYHYLFSEIDKIIESLKNSTFEGHNGFKQQVLKMKELFQYDKSSIICFGPTLFSLLECLNINGKYFKNYTKKDFISLDFFRTISDSHKLKLITEASVFKITKEFYSFLDFKKYDFKKDGLNRNVVTHGILPPDQISITEFCKLILICSTFAQI